MSKADELLRELVACKDLKERCAALAEHGLCLPGGKEREASVDEYSALQAEYARRQPLAWSAARAYLNEKLHEPIKDAGAADNPSSVNEHPARASSTQSSPASPPHAAAERTIPAGLKFGDTYQDTDGKVYGVGAGGGSRTVAAAEPEKPVAKLLERSELPATLGLWFDEQGNYYRLADSPLYASPSAQPIAREPTGAMIDAALNVTPSRDMRILFRIWYAMYDAALKSAGKEST